MQEKESIQNLIEFHQRMMNEAAMADSKHLYDIHREALVKLQDELNNIHDPLMEGYPV